MKVKYKSKGIQKLFFPLFNFVIFCISLLIPKTKKIIIVGGWVGRRFADNSRYLYLFLVQHKKEYKIKKVIYVSHDNEIIKELREKNHEAYNIYSIQSIWYHLRAKIHIVDQCPFDINPFFSVRCDRINLWHGFPIKTIGMFCDKKIDKQKNLKRMMSTFVNNNKFFHEGLWYDFKLLVTSSMSEQLIGRAFNKEKDQLIQSIYPRVDYILNPHNYDFLLKEEENIIDKIKLLKDKGYSIVIYLPTYKEGESSSFLNSSENEVIKFFKELQNEKIIFIIKYHFAQKKESNFSLQYDNVINLKPECDVYPFIILSDILISDYSSVIFDFMCLRRPVILYPYDIEEYRDNRGFIVDYNKFVSGDIVYNLDTLKQSIIYCLNNYEKYLQKYMTKMDKIINTVYSLNCYSYLSLS